MMVIFLTTIIVFLSFSLTLDYRIACVVSIHLFFYFAMESIQIYWQIHQTILKIDFIQKPKYNKNRDAKSSWKTRDAAKLFFFRLTFVSLTVFFFK